MKTYSKKFEILWSDIDMNGHMKHTSYSNYATNVRIGYLHSCDITMAEFSKWNMGPVIMREFIEYMREVKLGELIEIDLQLIGMSKDGKKWALRHNIYREKKIASRITMEGGWLGLSKRSLVEPPEKLFKSFLAIKNVKDYKVISNRRFYLGLKFNQVDQ